jgi:hypothetical protein
MLYAATQVVLEILSRCDPIALDDVIVRADVHQRVFSRQAWLAGLGGSEVRYPRRFQASADRAAQKRFAKIPSSHTVPFHSPQSLPIGELLAKLNPIEEGG